MFFLHKKNVWHRETCTQTAHRSFTDRLFAFRNFTQNSFYTAETYSHGNLYAQKNMYNSFYRQTVFTQKILRTEVLRTEGFTHNNMFFYIHTFFTHRCLYTDTNCTQKLVHTARVYTQPTFTQRGFTSPSWSPTFRVPPLNSHLQPGLWSTYWVRWTTK